MKYFYIYAIVPQAFRNLFLIFFRKYFLIFLLLFCVAIFKACLGNVEMNWLEFRLDRKIFPKKIPRSPQFFVELDSGEELKILQRLLIEPFFDARAVKRRLL